VLALTTVSLGACGSEPETVAHVPAGSAPTPSPTLPATSSPSAVATGPFRLRDGSTARVEGDEVVFTTGQGQETDREPCGYNGIDYRRAVALMREFQSAITRDDAQGAAALVLYPLSWSDANHKRLLRTRADFIDSFGALFPPAERSAIARPDALALSCSDQGFMIGDGVVWGGVGARGRYGIITVNPPVLGG
jgi:hypothetical protein